jgi:hypothetical protein
VAVSEELVWLIGQLRGTANRRERLRLLARGWRTLRDLSPTDRLMVAKELGFDGAEHLVEQLARRGGASPTLVLELLEQANDATPEQIAAMMHGAVQPEARRSLGERFLTAAKTWVADLESWDPEAGEADSDELEADPDLFPDPDPVATKPLAPLPDDQVAPEPPRPEPTHQVPIETDDEPTGKPLVEPVVELDGPEISEALETDAEPGPALEAYEQRDHAEPPKKEEPAPIEPAPPKVLPPEPEPDDEPPAPTTPSREPTADRREEPAVLTVDIPAGLEQHSSVIRRLHFLAEETRSLAGLGPPELAAILDAFPVGWARRRALEVLFRANVPVGFSDALALIEQLDDPAHRAWALSTLISTRSLELQHVDELLEMEVSPTMRRRLRRMATQPPTHS